MGPKGAKGGSPLSLKARWVPNHNWAHLSHFWPQNGRKDPQDPFWPRPTMGHFQTMSSCNHQRPPEQLSSILALKLRGIPPISPCTPYSRLQEWCIYGIIHLYAPLLLSNLMVTFSGPNSMIPNQGPKIQFPFQSRTLQVINLAIHGSYQKTIQGPQPPFPAAVGLAIISGLFQGPFSEVIHQSISCQGSKYFNTPWTNQLVHTGRNQLYLYVLGPIGPVHILLWEFNHTV
ncbi:hypothetical protein O181_020829 [Austropuccinia psidii MF-1]|uniref:Uncharacterized protein n=1 Tax=Austropuccinia psidii MF-1 TaxID=1389203 RepID=A0A9Q3CC11_9BASI|nr:hypothetical protein [Austropuccinia psidii MF-1]